MSQQPIAQTVAAAPATEVAEPEPLRGVFFEVVRFTWTAALFINIIYFAAGLPRSFTIASTLSPESVERLAAIGLSPRFPAWYLIALDTVTFALFTGVAVILFRRRSQDRLALVGAYMLVFTAMLYTAPGYEAHAPLFIIAAGMALAELAQVMFLLIFPNGQFRPRWFWLILPPLFLWRFIMANQFYLPWLYADDRTGDNYPFMRQIPLDIALYFLVILAAVALQIVRYRKEFNASERQQAKWLVWGITIGVVVVGVTVLSINIIPSLQPREGSAVMMRMVGRTVRQFALCMIPITMLYSIMRHRLWHIDFLINRTMVYLPLTSLLAGVFAAVAIISQRFFLATTGQTSDGALIVATLILTVLITPMRTEIQAWVDRRFKEAPDPFKMLRQFDNQVQSVVDIIDRERLLGRLLDETVAAYGAAGGAVYVVESGLPSRLRSTPKWTGPIALQYALEVDGACVGWLALGERANGAPYSEAETNRLCETIARVAEVVVAMHAAWVAGAQIPTPMEPVALPLPERAVVATSS